MAMRKKGTGKYSGVLATPMQHHHFPRETVLGGAVPEETWRAKQGEADAKNCSQFVERVEALFTHYDVPFGDFTTLALNLAMTHVRGFQFRSRGEKRRGRPSGVGTVEELIGRTEQYREILALADKLGVKQACEHLSTRKGARCYGIAPATLRKWVTDAKRASADDLSNLAFRLARFLVDRSIVGPLLEDDANAGPGARAGAEAKRPLRRK